jgi:DNA-binding beta-propeller fold protein YncE
MKIRIILLNRALVVILAGCFILSFSGCQEPITEEKIFEPVFFPPPPNQPRLQFLTAYSGGENFDVAKPSFLETFVLGESEIPVGTIVNPYGVSIHNGKIYVCDVGQGNIKVLDLVHNTFTTFTSGRSLQNPVNIFIEPDGTKYVADSKIGAVAVYNADDKLVSFLGKKLGIIPIDVVVRGNQLYLTDANKNQVLVLDKRSGKLIQRIGEGVEDETLLESDKFFSITDLGLDSKGDIYVSDKIKSRVTRFNQYGEFVRLYGRYGSSADSLVRAKGIAFDREDRMWVVDAGPACAVKVFRNDGRLLMYFGTLGSDPGQMYLPAAVVIDYENVDLFREYAVEGAELEFVVIVTNQFGSQKVSVYGFGSFPEHYSLQASETQSVPTEKTGTEDKSEVVE